MLGVGLHGLAPDAAERADDADGDRRRVIDGIGQRPADGQRGLADFHVGLGRRRRHGQAGGVDLEQRQHARLVGGDDLGRDSAPCGRESETSMVAGLLAKLKALEMM